jgi:hypothetical protein
MRETSRLEPILEKEVPKSVSAYLKKLHETIINDYHAPDGKYSESCGLIALDVAKLFLQSGKRPYIMKVSEDVREGSIVRTKRLSPQAYGGRVHWGAHQVCCCDDMAYARLSESRFLLRSIQKLFLARI